MSYNKDRVRRYLDYAKRVSLKSEFVRAPMGCVVVYKNKILKIPNI